MAHRLKAVVHGNVQGVGFRYWAHHTGEKLGVHGWVRNEPNGTVAVEAEATDKNILQALFVELHKGPAAAQVTQVEARWEELDAPHHLGFRVA